MPWPKGQPFTPEMIAKRTASLKASGAKQRKPDANGRYTCPTCRVARPSSDFFSSRRSPSGLSSQCRGCHSRTSIESRDVERARRRNRFCEANRRARLAGTEGEITELMWMGLVNLLGLGCLCCGATSAIEIDHIVPLSRGGRNEPDNLQPLCSSCNDKKHTKTRDYRTDGQRAAVAAWVLEFKRVESADAQKEAV